MNKVERAMMICVGCKGWNFPKSILVSTDGDYGKRLDEVAEEAFEKYINSLNILIEPIVQFFDKVLVMDKDENIKNNRLALLENLREKFDPICDFEKL